MGKLKTAVLQPMCLIKTGIRMPNTVLNKETRNKPTSIAKKMLNDKSKHRI